MRKNTCQFLEQICPDAYQFLRSDLSLLQTGRYEFPRGVYASIDEYDTYERRCLQYESHRRYYDWQLMVSGCEVIELKGCGQDRRTGGYDPLGDCAFYGNELRGERVCLTAGEGGLIEPGTLHMPCLRDGFVACHVRKAVVKIPASLFHEIRMLVMDVDGTLTDGKIHIGAQGELFKAFNVKDGYGIAVILRDKNIRPAVITGRESCIVAARCSELHIEDCCQGVNDKLACLCQLAERRGIALSHVAYIGDDVNDLDCMRAVKKAGGITACPRNASAAILDLADYVSSYDGGDGAVRDFIEYLIL